MIKHIFSDIDGTILDNKGRASSYTKSILGKSTIPFTLVSARSPQKMFKIIEQLGIQGIHVSFNGALIFKKNGQEITTLKKIPINYDLAKKLVLDVRSKFPNVGISLYDEENWNVDVVNVGISREQSVVEVDFNKVVFSDYFSNKNTEIFKVSIIEYDQSIFNEVADYIRSKYGSENLTIQGSLSGYLEITHMKAKKLAGIEFIMNYENIDKKDCVAFGDGPNDIPMFEVVDHVVVMDNANESVKKYATYITKSNIEDGVAYAIENYLPKL